MFVLTMALSRPFKEDRLALPQSFNVSLSLQMSPDLDTSNVTSAGSLGAQYCDTGAARVNSVLPRYKGR